MATKPYGFAIVVSGALLPASASIALVQRRGKAGFLSMLSADELAAFAPIEQVTLPVGSAYLISAADSGMSTQIV